MPYHRCIQIGSRHKRKDMGSGSLRFLYLSGHLVKIFSKASIDGALMKNILHREDKTVEKGKEKTFSIFDFFIFISPVFGIFMKCLAKAIKDNSKNEVDDTKQKGNECGNNFAAQPSDMLICPDAFSEFFDKFCNYRTRIKGGVTQNFVKISDRVRIGGSSGKVLGYEFQNEKIAGDLQ